MKPIIGITMGDPAGIGPEISVKALAHSEIYNDCTPIIIGDEITIEDANRFTGLHFKLCGFKMGKETGRFTSVSGINTTIRLPIIRTFVDHGTAFDKAGKNTANEESMLDSINLGVKMAKRKC